MFDESNVNGESGPRETGRIRALCPVQSCPVQNVKRAKRNRRAERSKNLVRPDIFERGVERVGAKHRSQICKMGSSKTIMDLFQPAAKRFKVCASDNTPNSKPLLQVISQKLPLSSKSSNTSSLTTEQQSRIEFNRCLAKSKRNLKACSQKVSKSKEQGLGYVKLEELLVEETWLEALHGELQKPYAKRVCEFVEKEIKGSGVDIFPPQHLIFNALNTTPFDRVKAVIIGQDPYHGPGQAMGLSFSVPEGVKIPSSLANIFKEIRQDVGCSLPSHGNLEKWAVQGVLLLNTVLTGDDLSGFWMEFKGKDSLKLAKEEK